MSTNELINSAVEHLRASASVKTVYGEPVAAESGEGAGGGVAAKPVGVVEISDRETTFVRFGQPKRLAWAAAIGSGIASCSDCCSAAGSRTC
jgi:uncharacterized spore protein YtfJ